MKDSPLRNSAGSSLGDTALATSDENGDDASGTLITVLETADPTLLPVVTSLLDGAGIPHFVQGDRALGMLPLGPFSTSLFGHAMAARIRVPAEHAAEAEALLRAEPQVDTTDTESIEASGDASDED